MSATIDDGIEALGLALFGEVVVYPHYEDVVDAVEGAPLVPRDARALALRFGLEDGEPRTFEQVGEIMGVSHTTIRAAILRGLAAVQADRKAMERLGEVYGMEGGGYAI